MHGESPNSLLAIVAGLGDISSPPIVIMTALELSLCSRLPLCAEEAKAALGAIMAGLGDISSPPVTIIADLVLLLHSGLPLCMEGAAAPLGAIMAGLGDISSPPPVIIACVLRLACRRGVCVIGHWSSAPPVNEGNCRRRCAAEVPFVPAGVVMFREGRISLIPLFYSTSHFPSYYYQLCELETDNKLRGRRWPAVHLLVANALAVLLSGFPRLLGSAQS